MIGTNLFNDSIFIINISYVYYMLYSIRKGV